MVAAIEQAERLIYLETQFLRSPVIAEALEAAGRNRPGARLIVVLPAAPDDIAFEGNRDAAARHGEWLQIQAIRKIRAGWGPRVAFFSLAQPRELEDAPEHDRSALESAPIVYVHAKVSIFDSQTAIVGSANLNGRSMKWDTEAAVLWRDPAAVGAFQSRLWAAHLGDASLPADADALAAWSAIAQANAAVAPAERAGFILPYDAAIAASFARRRYWIPTNMI